MSWLLKPFSLLFLWGVFLRNKLYDVNVLRSERLPGRVISIGNLAVGGTGKSPVVMYVAREIIASGGRPAIITRGYRSGLHDGEWQVLLGGKVLAGVSRSDVVADEARMQSMALTDVPVIVGSRRVQAVREFQIHSPHYHITHWILDDGFQHRKLARDLDIVLIDARSPFGDVLPSGRFREPVSALGRADMVLITKADTPDQLQRVKDDIKRANPRCGLAEIKFLVDAPKVVCGSPSDLPSRWGLVAGISQPNDFLKTALGFGLEIKDKLLVADHSRFDAQDLKSISRKCDAIITTEKDFARSEEILKSLNIPVYVLPIQVAWIGEKPVF